MASNINFVEKHITLEIMMLVIGFLLGLVSVYIYRYVRLNSADKAGKHYKDYKKMPFVSQLKHMIRRIIVQYNVVRKNHDFSLRIKYGDTVIMQIVHRAYFPFLSGENPTFGLAIYIPSAGFDETQERKTESILYEARPLFQTENDPFSWYATDLGQGIKTNALMVARLIKEVLKLDLDSNKLTLELYDEGELPFICSNEREKYLKD